MSDPNYGLLDRVLHRLALQYAPIAELSFDLDQGMVRRDHGEIVDRQHVFVTGLARAGTTVLMRRFHASGLYRSLTYRDMPFVLAPNFWRRVSSLSRKDVAAAERAHGDSVLVDVDSPESLDEVFWRVFAGDEYIARDCLRPHQPSADVIERYVRYVNAILMAQDTQCERYLCKNNNNILRLGAIHRAFPRALVLIPFREPRAHAESLLRQHRQFSKMQRERPFTLSYMTWLGHHEFGLDHRPFRFGPESTASPRDPESLDYWLHLWCEVYAWLERSKNDAALFVCYEDLCDQPATWSRLAGLAGLTGEREQSGDAFRQSTRGGDPVAADRALVERAQAIYERLVTRARADLG